MLVCSVDIGIRNYAYSIIDIDKTGCSDPFGRMCVVTADKLCLTDRRIKDQAALTVIFASRRDIAVLTRRVGRFSS